MSNFIRFQPEGRMTYHVTSRCIEGKAFLKPIPQVNEAFLGILGKTMEHYKQGVEVHNLVVMSNHYHLMVSVEGGKDLADFMRMFNGEIARELNRVWKTKGSILDHFGMVDDWKWDVNFECRRGPVVWSYSGSGFRSKRCTLKLHSIA